MAAHNFDLTISWSRFISEPIILRFPLMSIRSLACKNSGIISGRPKLKLGKPSHITKIPYAFCKSLVNDWLNVSQHGIIEIQWSQELFKELTRRPEDGKGWSIQPSLPRVGMQARAVSTNVPFLIQMSTYAQLSHKLQAWVLSKREWYHATPTSLPRRRIEVSPTRILHDSAANRCKLIGHWLDSDFLAAIRWLA